MKKILYSSIVLILTGVIATSVFTHKEFVKDKNQDYTEKEQIKNDSDIIYEGTIQGYYLNRDPEKLFEISDIVVIAEYQKDISSKIYDRDVYTTSEFKILKTLKNKENNKLGEKISARYLGGTISIEEFLKSRDDATKEKLGLNQMTTQEKKSKKIKFSTEDIGDKKITENPQRILFLHYDEKENDYTVVSSQYGMVSFENNLIFNGETKQKSSYSFLK